MRARIDPKTLEIVQMDEAWRTLVATPSTASAAVQAAIMPPRFGRRGPTKKPGRARSTQRDGRDA